MLCNRFAQNETLTICVDKFSTVSSRSYSLYDYIDVVVDDDDNAKDDDDNVVLCSVQCMAMFKGLENMFHAMYSALNKPLNRNLLVYPPFFCHYIACDVFS